MTIPVGVLLSAPLQRQLTTLACAAGIGFGLALGLPLLQGSPLPNLPTTLVAMVVVGATLTILFAIPEGRRLATEPLLLVPVGCALGVQALIGVALDATKPGPAMVRTIEAFHLRQLVLARCLRRHE